MKPPAACRRRAAPFNSRKRDRNTRRQPQPQLTRKALNIQSVGESLLAQLILELTCGLLQTLLAQGRSLQKLALGEWEAEPGGRFCSTYTLGKLSTLSGGFCGHKGAPVENWRVRGPEPQRWRQFLPERRQDLRPEAFYVGSAAFQRRTTRFFDQAYLLGRGRAATTQVLQRQSEQFFADRRQPLGFGKRRRRLLGLNVQKRLNLSGEFLLQG